MKALIPLPASARGFLPATKAQPKEMLLVVDRPAIQYVVEEGLASAADEVVIINSREKKAIEDHFSPNPELVATLRARGKDQYADAVEQVGNYNVGYVYQTRRWAWGTPCTAPPRRRRARRSTCFWATCWCPATRCCPACRRCPTPTAARV